MEKCNLIVKVHGVINISWIYVIDYLVFLYVCDSRNYLLIFMFLNAGLSVLAVCLARQLIKAKY